MEFEVGKEFTELFCLHTEFLDVRQICLLVLYQACCDLLGHGLASIRHEETDVLRIPLTEPIILPSLCLLVDSLNLLSHRALIN